MMIQKISCIQCGTQSIVDQWHRELPFCRNCHITPRWAGMIIGIMRSIYGDIECSLFESERRLHIRGVGISDSGYSDALAEKFSYRNTWYHQEPKLDICEASSCALYENLDFVTCSDVIEHTKSPPYVVLSNIYGMLRRGGSLILSAPTSHNSSTLEWYPAADSIEVLRFGDKFEVKWSNFRGNYVDKFPCFHGGPGDTLEMRYISLQDLIYTAEIIGYNVKIIDFVRERGYYWPIYQMSDYPGRGDARIMILTRK